MKLKIGNVTLENNLVLAPMAGVTDLPFRLLCKEQGAGLICTEMVSAKAIYYKNKNTESLMAIEEKERPVSLQLFGSEPDLMAEIARQIEERNFDILDINMGCPVPKVVNNGEGSALMKNPRLVHEIIYKVSRAIKKPLTVKIRKGFTEDTVNAVEIARIAQDAGAAAIAVHGRTREQYYSGQAPPLSLVFTILTSFRAGRKGFPVRPGRSPPPPARFSAPSAAAPDPDRTARAAARPAPPAGSPTSGRPPAGR